MSALQIIDNNGMCMPIIGGFFMAGMKPAEPEPKPELPEFHFSTRAYVHLAPRKRPAQAPAAPIHIIGAPTECCPVGLNKARKPRPKRDLPAHEVGWLNLQPHFPQPVKEGMVMPHGTTKPHGLDRFLSRVDEINAIAKTQHLELPSLAAEFKANGLSAISLSSSSAGSDDDELEAANLAEMHLKRVPYDPDPETLAALTRRIDWERYVMACSSSTRIYAKIKDDGKMTLACENRTWDTDRVKSYAKQIKRLVHGRSAADLQNDRDRAHFYGAAVLALMTPEQQRAWRLRERRARAYLDVADNNVERESFPVHEGLVLRVDPDEEFAKIAAFGEPITGGPQELGLHNLLLDDEENAGKTNVARWEPSEYELWGEEDDNVS